MRGLVFVLVGGGIMAVLGVVVMVGPAYYMGTHTPHCPLSHKLRDGSECVVVDREGDRTLVLHADEETGERYLEIVAASGSRYYRMPEHVEALSPGGDRANLLPGETEWFAVNGEWQRLQPLP